MDSIVAGPDTFTHGCAYRFAMRGRATRVVEGALRSAAFGALEEPLGKAA